MRDAELADDDDDDDEEQLKGSTFSYPLSRNQKTHGSQLFNRGARKEGRESAEGITVDEEEGGGRYGGKDPNMIRGNSLGKKGTTLIAEELYHQIGLRPNAFATSAVNAIDTWMLQTGRYTILSCNSFLNQTPFPRYLRHYPLLRLAFILYLTMLHFWVLVVLVVHLHSLEIDSDRGNAVIAGNRGIV